MNRVSQPTKEQVRLYMVKRFFAATPPPDPEQIKLELGFEVVVESDKVRKNCAERCI